jgi:hypothetical protein
MAQDGARKTKQQTRVSRKAAGVKAGRKVARKAKARVVGLRADDGALNAAAVVVTWADDPLSGFPPFAVPAPNLAGGRLPVRILDPQPPPREYPLGTAEFRYWVAASALARGVDFWSAVLPSNAAWRTGGNLPVRLDAGTSVGGSYRRSVGIEFFHESAAGRIFFSCESPDLVCHELGHAVLDIIRPEIFNVADVEQASFHEAFGDISAMLCALQAPQVRAAILAETGGRLRRDSRVSRIAESIGRVQNRVSPHVSPPEFLRNAANEHNYRPPSTLTMSGPHTSLTSQPHNFCRVFTGAFLELLDNFLAVVNPQPRERDLADAAGLAARVLVAAVVTSPPVTGYYAQVAGQMVAHAGRLNVSPPLRQQFAAAASSAFVRRGILSLRSAMTTGGMTRAAGRRAFASEGDELPAVAARGDLLGLGERALLVRAPLPPGGRVNMRATGVNVEESAPPLSEEAAHHFLELLLARGQLDLGGYAPNAACVAHPRIFKTHALVEQDGGLSVQRLGFNCGFEDM